MNKLPMVLSNYSKPNSMKTFHLKRDNHVMKKFLLVEDIACQTVKSNDGQKLAYIVKRFQEEEGKQVEYDQRAYSFLKCSKKISGKGVGNLYFQQVLTSYQTDGFDVVKLEPHHRDSVELPYMLNKTS